MRLAVAMLVLVLSAGSAGRQVSTAGHQLTETDAYSALHNALAEYEAGGSRPTLKDRLTRLVARYPQDEVIDYARDAASILTSMIAEDLKSPVFTGSALERRIQQLIFDLRDARGFQQSQPGSIDFLAPHLPRGPGQELVEIGQPAVPFLVAARNDQRLTRAVYKRLMFRSIRPISECISQILTRIGQRRMTFAMTGK